MRAVKKGHTRDGCAAHRETVRRVVFHFKERPMNGSSVREVGARDEKGRESGEGDGGQNRMSDEKAETQGGRGEGERRREATRRRGRETNAGSEQPDERSGD